MFDSEILGKYIIYDDNKVVLKLISILGPVCQILVRVIGTLRLKHHVDKAHA
jgi:hypothetical protein